VKSHERPSGSSRSRGRSRTGSSRSCGRSRTGSSHSRGRSRTRSEKVRTGTLPKNLIGCLSRAGSLGRRGSEATTHASRVHAKLALGMEESSNTEGEERDLLNRSTWV
jgi:hypothetical protein